jgi:tryptophanyl-tRNA synthetase
MSALPDHYEALRGAFDYDRPAVDVGDLESGVVERAFAATTDENVLRGADDRQTLFVASAGLTGTPHVGTVAQMFAVKRLSEAGFDTEFLLADYEKYAGSGRDLDVVQDLADDYRAFLDGIGYEGRVRTQWDATDVMQTAFRLAPYFDPDASIDLGAESTEWVEDLRAAYDADQVEPGDASGGTEFGRSLTGLLCLADFVHPTLAGGYDQTVFVLGADEHALVLANEQYLADAPIDAAFEGLFTRMVPGLDGYPKMAKTIPGSGITMDQDPETVRELVLRAAEEDGDAPPEASTVFAMQCLVSDYDAGRLADHEAACREGGESWDAAVDAYADYLADLSRAWPA